MKLQRKESDVLREVMRLLSSRGIFHLRRNVGAVKNERGQHVQFGYRGEADIIAYPQVRSNCPYCKSLDVIPLFIECKSSTGKQSAPQRLFQRAVESAGMAYLIVRSASEVEDWLEKNC